MIEFEKDETMKAKVYPDDYAVEGQNRRPVIIITHDKCTFSANDGVRQVWTKKRDTYLRLKGRGQRIMTSKFLLPFS